MERNEATPATAASSPPRSSSPPNRYTNTSLQDFRKLIMLDREKTCFELVYFILNTLNHLLGANHWYCYCEKMYVKVDGLVIYSKYRASHGQVCKRPHIFPDFEKDINQNMFNMKVSNAFRGDLFTVVATGTVVNIGAFLWLKAFDTVKE